MSKRVQKLCLRVQKKMCLREYERRRLVNDCAKEGWLTTVQKKVG